jgi:DNA-binding NarL/FixJ family response regulator
VTATAPPTSVVELPVTRRQHELLYLLSQGLTYERIAQRMGGLTVNTVKTHARRLYDRLGARNQTHAVRRGFERGLLHPDQELEVRTWRSGDPVM